MLQDVIKQYNGVEVPALEVYKDIFKIGEGYIQCFNEDSHNLKANPLGYYRNAGKDKGHYRVFFEDTFEETLKELQQADFAIINGLTYFGRRNTQDHASKMYAMIFDIDGVTDKTLRNFLHGAFTSEFEIYPLPNYIVTSGHGVHLYYLFEEPVPLFPNIKLQLKNLKYALTKRMWNMYTSTIKEPQIQGINQGFRVIGGKSKIEGYTTQAFRLNTHPFNLEQLGRYVEEKDRVDESKLYKESKLTLQDAKTKYPEWYKKVILDKDKTVNKWDIAGKVNGKNPYALYDWWKTKIETGATFGHRYFCIMALVIYAIKNGVSLDQLRKDSYALIPYLNSLHEEPFTKSDVDSALECFDDRYATFPIDDISKLTAIAITKNKRNGRKQKDHIKIMNFIRDEVNNNKDWRNKEGRPTKQSIVEQWQQTNPNGRKADCIRDLGIDRKTVSKYWQQAGK